MSAEPRKRLPLALALIGVSGSGKSTVGRRLAAALDADFLEGDDYHSPESIAKMRAGTPLDDTDRWPWLAEIGRAIAVQCEIGQPVVAACSALRRVYRNALIAASGRELIFVHLRIDAAILRSRLQLRSNHFMPSGLLTSQLATLEPLGPDEDGTEIDETGTIQTTVDAIVRWLEHYKYEQERP